MTREVLRRIDTLESRCRTANAQAKLRIRIVLRAVDSRIGLGKATCQRSRQPSGSLFEIVSFYGCPLSKAEPSVEEKAFRGWIESVPIDGVQRDFTRPGEFGSSHEAL